MDGPMLPGVVVPPVPWRYPAAVAPALALVRDGDDVLIRYRYAGVEPLVRMPFTVWMALKLAVRIGTFEDLGEHAQADGWTPWGAGTGQVRRDDGHVIVRFASLDGPVEHRLPGSIWDQLLTAIRARAADNLDTVRAREPVRDGLVGGV